MNTNNIDIKSDIEAILGMKDLGYKSTLVLAWEEVQSLYTQNSMTMTGLLGSLCILEQIGNLFQRSVNTKVWTGSSGGLNSFKEALFHFSDLDEEEVNAIYGLRCSLAHDYSLSNINSRINNTRKDYAYTYLLNWEDNTPPVILPKVDWKGDFSIFDATKKQDLENQRTIIGATSIINIVHSVQKLLQDLHKNGQLECKLDPTNIQYRLMSQYALLFRKPNE